MTLVTIARSRRQDHLACATFEADYSGEMPARQMLDAARRTSAPRQLDHSPNGFLLALSWCIPIDASQFGIPGG
jgi:hypothetical protein